ncbi:hypothetical protein QNK12_12080 [Neobacillus cucumis]|nr:hypothetical protein QNK12_12080 [Neobacillus cucumis]
MSTYYEDKVNLLLDLKAEALNQLIAVNAEDPEQFLRYTESFNSIIEAINGIDSQGRSLIEGERKEVSKIIQEIIGVREEISSIIPSLQEKVKQKFLAEKQMNNVKRRYNREGDPLPSIFLDKKV